MRNMRGFLVPTSLQAAGKSEGLFCRRVKLISAPSPGLPSGRSCIQGDMISNRTQSAKLCLPERMNAGEEERRGKEDEARHMVQSMDSARLIPASGVGRRSAVDCLEGGEGLRGLFARG